MRRSIISFVIGHALTRRTRRCCCCCCWCCWCEKGWGCGTKGSQNARLSISAAHTNIYVFIYLSSTALLTPQTTTNFYTSSLWDDMTFNDERVALYKERRTSRQCFLFVSSSSSPICDRQMNRNSNAARNPMNYLRPLSGRSASSRAQIYWVRIYNIFAAIRTCDRIVKIGEFWRVKKRCNLCWRWRLLFTPGWSHMPTVVVAGIIYWRDVHKGADDE